MRAPDSRRSTSLTLTALVAAAALAVLAGCSSTPAGSGSPRPPAVERNGSAEAGRTPADAAQAAEATDVDEAGSLQRRAANERRRRDYPEIETSEAGFTITEQIRIPNDVRADYDRALALLAQGRHEEGIAVLRTVTEMAPDVTAPYIDLGIAYAQAGDLERSEEALLAASELTPDHPIIHNELGILYRKTGRFAEARASYERALTIYPGFHFANRNLAVLCDLFLADLDCALEHYEAYMLSVVEDPEVTIWMADIRNRLSR